MKLPRLPISPDPLVMQVYWQQVVTQIETQFNTLQGQVSAIAAAQATADAVRETDAISGGFTAPTNIVSAADAGSNVTLTIASHTRYYGDGTSVAVTGGTITGQPYATDVAVYYDDPTRAGGAVAYQATTTLKTAQNNYASGRHLVGTVTTPAAGAAATTGGTAPPGSGYTPGGTSGHQIP